MHIFYIYMLSLIHIYWILNTENFLFSYYFVRITPVIQSKNLYFELSKIFYDEPQAQRNIFLDDKVCEKKEKTEAIRFPSLSHVL